jgi:N6-adenosine-specific RNA methylase IME4
MIERMVPNGKFFFFRLEKASIDTGLGKYLEIFGRKNNLRDYWITIGNEL